jgi:AraC family transcriptional regulator
MSVRKTSVPLKTYPAITFVLTIKGVNEMNFRIEKKDSFKVMGLLGYITDELVECEPGICLSPLWNDFLENYNSRFWNNGNPNYYTEPFHQIGAYWFQTEDGKTKAIIGAEYKGVKPDGVTAVETIPPATWAVFSINGNTGSAAYNAAYTRILTEWFPTSNYKRDESVPNLDVYPGGTIDENYVWEIWLPVLNK